MSKEKEKQKLIQEKCQQLLNDMLRDDDNKYCVDCDAKGPRWASWNLGLFLCIRCAGIHRNLGVHISKVKSVNLDTWTPEQVVSMQQMGNSRARALYEKNLPESFRRPQSDSTLENFIRAKYEHKKYLQEGAPIPAPVSSVDWSKEIEETLGKKKSVARETNQQQQLFPKLKMEKKTPVVVMEMKEEEVKPDLLFDLNDIDFQSQGQACSTGNLNTELLQGLTLNQGQGQGQQEKMSKESILGLYNNTTNKNPFQQQQNF